MIEEELLDDFLSLRRNHDLVRTHCARRLMQGQLAAVVGAGATHSAGFLGWFDLVETLCRSLGVGVPANGANSDVLMYHMDLVKAAAGADYLSLVRRVLYAGSAINSLDPARSEYDYGLDNSREIRALASLLMSHPKGLLELLTFNFDCFVDDYIARRNLRVQSIGTVPRLSSCWGVRILHAHGVLPRSGELDPNGIVFSANEYTDRGSAGEWWHASWRSEIRSFLTRYQTLFVGIGGKPDAWHDDVQSAVREYSKVGERRISGFWLLGDTPNEEVLQRIARMNGVPVLFDSYDAVWEFVESISAECQGLLAE